MQLKSFKEVLDELIPEPERIKALDDFYDINYAISTLLVEYRLKHNMSQKQLAEILDISRYLICKYENGDYNFSLMQVCEICDKLDIEMKLEFTTKEEKV